MSKEDLIVTRNGVPFEDQMEGIRQFKEAAFRAAEKAKLPQDVEEFIAEHEFADAGREDSRGIPASDLRAWMAGHARVPVELIEFIEAKEHHLPIEDRHVLSFILSVTKESS